MAQPVGIPEPETLSGTVEDIICYKSDSGFTVFDLNAGGELVTVVGELGAVETGEEVALTGNFVSHPSYGNQFKATLCERKLPATAGAIRKYLGGGSFKGVGPALASRIVSRFGDETLAVLEKEPMRLAEVKGITTKKAAEMAAEFERAFGIRKVMLELQKYGLPASIAVRVWKRWGMASMEVIEADPFSLCHPEIGLEFPDADRIFSEKAEPDDSRRLKAGITFVLAHNLENGHSCLPEEKLLGAAASLLGTDSGLAAALEALLDEHRLEIYDNEGRRFFYLPELYGAETSAAGRIKLMLAGGEEPAPSVEEAISLMEKELGIEYDSLQRKALKCALRSHIFVLTGGPGTGKTTTLNALIRLLEEMGESVLLAAPTGRAAKRLSELTGREAKTIHRMLEVDFRSDELHPTFRKNEKNPLKCDTLIVDEMSMVDTLLFDALLRALPFSCRLILVGDADQLPSVGAGNVLRDIVSSDIVPSVCLDRIFRQAAESRIVTNAHGIIRGELPELGAKEGDFFFLPRATEADAADAVCSLVCKRLPEAYGFSPVTDIQVLCPGHRGKLGTWNLNLRLEKLLNPADKKKVEFTYNGATFREGDKVMQIRNNYDTVWQRDDGEMGSGVFNGDIGVIERIDRSMRMLTVRFDDRKADYPFENSGELEHAYAVTVHKSQGSEFEAVILPLFDKSPRLNYRNLLYTAVTRARKFLVIVGTEEAVAYTVRNNRRTGRYTNLRPMLEEILPGGGL
ncbi:MAG TPA: ATP-dependent RecD-like DNA helicase [Oscillospiraceae bacterium]|nr:ATP-dependent RecD-like DNA helicase [Oscillospiraceae bacterium]HRW56214.1 ATP-dependent RecD-like DNA helicase [Oscillospiraceae bacterium]